MPTNWSLTATPATLPSTGGQVSLHVGYTLSTGSGARHLTMELLDENGLVLASAPVDISTGSGEQAPTIVGLTGATAKPPAGQYGVRSSDGTAVTGSGQDFAVQVPGS